MYYHSHYRGPRRKRERGEGSKNTFEDIIAENFLTLVKETDIQIQEAQRVSNRINPKRTTPRHRVIKMTKIKDKERILKAAMEITYKETPIRL